jgi:class 3 adenylate cyclase
MADPLPAPELVDALVRMGVARGDAEEAVRRGDPESVIFDPVLLKERSERTMTLEQIEARGGLPAPDMAAIMQAFGLPAPPLDEPAFTPAEARVFQELNQLKEFWPQDLMLQVARVYGRMLSRIAGSEAQAFWQHTVPYLRLRNPDQVTELGAMQAAFERLLPLADPLLLGVHRRWVEYELGQAAVRDAEQRAGAARLPGAEDVAFLFCDLKDFTRYAEVEGDEAAILVIDRFFDVVMRERGNLGRLVKSLGDGAMLAYDDPAEAVAVGARVIAAVGAGDGPGVHASVHHGVAIAREGDYFGGAVNLAARLLAFGERDQLVATGVVVQASGDRFRWASLGERPVRGVAHPVALFQLAQ